MALPSSTQASKGPNKSSNGASGRRHPAPSKPTARTTSKADVQSHGKGKPSVRPKAASIAGENPVTGVTSAYAIMASRIANRVAEMAEGLTFVERPPPKESPVADPEPSRRPRKLDMRLDASGRNAGTFSAPFLDDTLRKLLALQQRMLASTAEIARSSSGDGPDSRVVREQAAQSAELSRIIALICAEKARQGA